MRIEPYSVGSFLHVVKRGARGLAITQDEYDRRRFLRVLYFMNEDYYDENWELLIENKPFGDRPEVWPERKALVSILGYTLMPNHFHLLLRENNEGGMSSFMQKLGQSMTVHFNAKYNQRGSIFQGSFRSRTISDDTYFRYVAAYVLVKNTFELYPKGGLAGATNNFQDAWAWGLEYPFSSLGALMENRLNSIIDMPALKEVTELRGFKNFARDVIEGGKWTLGEFE